MQKCLTLLNCSLLCVMLFAWTAPLVHAQESLAEEHLQKGMDYFYFSMADSALYHLGIADSLYGELSLWTEQMKCKVGIVRSMAKNRQYAKAAALGDSAIAYGKEKVGENNASIGVLYAYKGFGDFLFQRGLEHSLKQIDIALEILERSNALREEQWVCYYNRAVIYFYAGQLQESKKEMEQCLEKIKYSSIIDKAGAGGVHNILGLIARREKNYKAALHHYHQALMAYDKFEKTQEKYSLDIVKSSPYLNIGNIYYEIGEYGKSEEYLNKALAINQKVLRPNDLKLGGTYYSIGNVLYFQHQYEQAIKQYDKAEEIFAQLPGAGRYHSGVLSNKGKCYLNLKQFDLAYLNLEKALKWRQSKANNDWTLEAESIRQIGEVHRVKKEWGAALELKQKAIDIYRLHGEENTGDLADYEEALATVYLEAGQIEKALTIFHQSLISNLPNLTSTISIEELPPIEKSFNSPTFLRALWGKAKAFYQLFLQSKNIKYLELANEHYLKCDELISLLRQQRTLIEDKIAFNGRVYHLYQGAVEVSYSLYKQQKEQAYVEQAFYFSERSKTQALQASIVKNNALHLPGIREDMVTEEKWLRDSIAVVKEQLSLLHKADDIISKEGLEEKLFDLNRNYDLLIDSMETYYPIYYKLRHSDAQINSQIIQKQILDDEQQLIEYFIGEKQLHVFLISATHVSWHTVAIPENLEASIEAYLGAIRDNHILELSGQTITPTQKRQADSTYASTGYQLYKLLLGPLSEEKLTPQLIIVPDGILGNIPFETLLSQAPTTIGAYHNYPFLLHQYQISYTYSALLLEQLKAKRITAALHNKLLAFAPQFADCSSSPSAVAGNAQSLRSNYFGPIQNKAEVLAIQQVVGGKGLFEKEATLANFIQESPHYAFLHIASHAKANDQNPALSLIGFSSEETDDCAFDKLRATRIANLSLSAEMVVLSACEGAAGKLQKGEGIQSLAMAFTYAGAKSLCTTLWSVQDKAMSDIMTDYYRGLESGSSKDYALRNAKLDYLTQHDNDLSHPFYWAAPILIGDATAVSFSGAGLSIPFWCYGLLGCLILFFAFHWMKNK